MLEKIHLRRLDPPDDLVDHPDDCSRIRRVLFEHGYEASLRQAEQLWRLHAETWAAGWWPLPDDDNDLYRSIADFISDA